MNKLKKKEEKSGATYRNSTFDPQITKKFLNLRKRKKSPGFDFSIEVQGKKILVHKEILLLRCEYFKTMLQHNFNETSSNSVSISFNKDVNIWSQVVDYIYSGVITINIENMFDIYTTSTYLLLDELKIFCSKFIKNSINHETVGTIHDIACQNVLTDIAECATDFMEMNFEDFTKHSAMLEWSCDLVKKLVSSDKLQVRSEGKVVQMICNWLSFEFGGRKHDMAKLIEEVRFSFLTPEKMLAAIDDDVYLKIIQHLSTCMEQHLRNPQPTHRPRLYHKGIYMLGMSLSDFEVWFARYLPNDGSLISLKAPPNLISTVCCATVLNGKVFLTGGCSNGQSSNQVLIYDPVEDIWSQGKPLKIARFKHGCCTFENKVYVFGGCGGGDVGLRSEVYSPAEDHWDYLPTDKSHKYRKVTKAAVVGDSVFIVSYDQFIQYRKHYRHLIEQFKPSTGEWNDIQCNDPDMLLYIRRPLLNIVGHERKLFIIRNEFSYVVYDMEMKTLSEGHFRPKGQRTSVRVQYYSEMVAFRDKLYVYESYHGHNLNFGVFDPKALCWNPTEDMFQFNTSVKGPSPHDFVNYIELCS